MYRSAWAQSYDIAANSRGDPIDDRDSGRQVERDRDCDRRERNRDPGNGIVTGWPKTSRIEKAKYRAGLKEFGPFILPEFYRKRVFRTRSRLAQSSLRKKSNTRSAIAGTTNNNHDIEAVQADPSELSTKNSGT